MKNRIDISTDGINAYARIEVNASKVGIRILIAMIILECALFVGLFTQLESEEVKAMIVPILLVMVLFIGLPVKYLLTRQ